MNIRKFLTIISFFLIILIGVFFTNLKKDSVSPIDNKILYEFEENSSLYDKIKSSENFLSDRIGFRNELVYLYMNLNNKVFNVMKHPLFEYGLNNELFFKFNQQNDDKDFIESFFNYLLNLQQFYNDRGVDFLFVMQPSKNEIYNEFVPKYINIEDCNYKRLINLIEGSNLNFLNNYNVFMEGKKNSRIYNKKSDIGHWTDDGAIIGINNIVLKLIESGYNLNYIDKDNYHIEKVIDRFIPASNLEINEEVIKYRLKNKHFSNFFDEKIKDINNPTVNYNMKIWKEITINEQHPYFDIMENNFINNDYKVLFFRGSYFTDKEKFIGEIFNKITAVHNYQNLLEPEYYTNIGKPDIVIFELAQTAINPSYFDIEKLSDKIFSKPYTSLEDYSEEYIDEATISINSKVKSVLIDLDVDIRDNFESAYIRLDDLIYDINLTKDNINKQCNFFTSILKEDIGNNNELILIKENNKYIYNLNNILNK